MAWFCGRGGGLGGELARVAGPSCGLHRAVARTAPAGSRCDSDSHALALPRPWVGLSSSWLPRGRALISHPSGTSGIQNGHLVGAP